MNIFFRCECPITSAIDVIGDKWSLVVIKQILLYNMKTFKEISECKESIATNILSARLKKLEEFKIISKNKLPHNKKSNYYILTQKGLDLTPIIVELTLWAAKNIKEFHPNLKADDRLEILKNNKEESIKKIIETYKKENW